MLAALLGACGAPLASSGQDQPDDQQAALATLDDQTGQSWKVRWHKDVHTPSLLVGRTAPLIVNPAGAEGAARGFLADHAAIFRMGDPHDELALDGSDADTLGMVHLRLHQQQAGIPVQGHLLNAHFDPAGALIRVDGRYAPLPQLARLDPTLSADQAQSSAIGALRTRPGTPTALVPALIIDPLPGAQSGTMAPRLAWRVEVLIDDPAAPGRVEVFVDAATGEAYRSADLLDQIAGSGVGVLGEQEPLDITERSGRYYLEATPGNEAAQKTYSAADKSQLPGHIVSSSEPDHWEVGVLESGAAVDAHAFMTATGNYFQATHGRRGPKDNGDGLHASVHFGDRYTNAFWNGRQLAFGDGDGDALAPLSGALDVVAHEYTHAVSESAAGLGHSDEPGALNEAVSDIFGCFVEHAARGGGANWRIGEDVLFLGDSFRDLSDPHLSGNPAHRSEQVLTDDDRGGIHLNSTIPSHAAFLMSEGGTNSVSQISVDGIGRAAAEQIWYRALRYYLGPASDFDAAADATVGAADDLFGADSTIAASVRAAWQAVGVQGMP